MGRSILLAAGLALLSSIPGRGQDFIMQGCYWSCPEDAVGLKTDTSTLNFWIQRMHEQAPELAYVGFSYLWLPSLGPQSPPQAGRLVESLRQSGIQAVANLDMEQDSASLEEQIRLTQERFQASAYTIHRKTGLNPSSTANHLNRLYEEGRLPELLIANLPYPNDPARLGKWAAEAIQSLSPGARPEIDPRVYDYPLRESLRKACTDSTYDVRHVFASSIRDASSVSGFNIVTMANHPYFKNQNNKKGDWDDPIEAPMLAYAYILSNNQIGLPTVYYGDYYGEQSELEEYLGKKPMKEKIGQLMKAHRDYIYGSTGVEYLNRFRTDKAAYYHSAAAGIDSTRVLIFQMDGTNTPAGPANRPMGGKDILVAINFGNDTLKLNHEVNTANLKAGDFFTDVLGNSLSPRLEIVPYDSTFGLPNAVYLSLPPRSYSILVQGRASPVASSRIGLSVESYSDYIELNWDVAYETQILGYEVERSVNGKPFEHLASITPLGNGKESAAYLYIDKDVYPNERLKYRIKLLDEEGGKEYSPPGATSLKKREMAFELVEGPSEWIKSILVKSNYEAVGQLEIFDAKGDKVLERIQTIKRGTNTTRLDLSALPDGVYYLNFSAGKGKEWASKLVKL